MARDPLDAFVLARLDREHMQPEAEATREAWLRRASFDLTGLPPTPAEIDEFLADKRKDAYETQAVRLLKSQRYGERQAQEWLDLARYADTSGYQSDTPREIWKWREWVINAFNANMPYDQFTIEQLAGDLLPNATLAQKVATGFNRNHPTNSEPGEEEDEYRSAYVVDRVNTTATVFMGVTLGCAQCHDHKYDPFSQRDYYAFYSFFNNIKERDAEFGSPRPSIPVPSPDQEPRLADLKARIDALKQRLEHDDSLTDARRQKEWSRKTPRQAGQTDRLDDGAAGGNALARRVAVEAPGRRLSFVDRAGAGERHLRHHAAPREKAHHGDSGSRSVPDDSTPGKGIRALRPTAASS